MTICVDGNKDEYDMQFVVPMYTIPKGDFSMSLSKLIKCIPLIHFGINRMRRHFPWYILSAHLTQRLVLVEGGDRKKRGDSKDPTDYRQASTLLIVCIF